MRNHPFNSVLDQQLRKALPAMTRQFRFMPADKSGKTRELLLNVFFSRQSDFIGVDDDDKIASVDVRSKDYLAFATEKVCYSHGDTAKRAVLGVNNVPFALDITRFG
jgi:hypothetical protein